MGKQIILVKKPKIIKPIKKKLELPKNVEAEETARISIDSRKQFFVRFPSIIADDAKISAKDKVRFKVIAPLDLKSKKQIKFEMDLVRG